MIRYILCAALSFSFASILAAEPPKEYQAVPKESLDKQRLILASAGCSLAAPNTDWIWLTPPNAKGMNYVCFSTKTGAMIPISIGEMVNGMDEHTQKELTEGSKKAAAKNGATVANEKFEASEIPLPGKSWRYSYEFSANLRRAVAIFYYVRTSAKAFVAIQGTSLDANDTPTFHAFISSLQLLAPPEKK